MTNELSESGGDQVELNKELEQFAVDLSRLHPRDDRLDRERIAFLAGQAFATAPAKSLKTLGLPLESRAWPAAFAAMTAVAATLLCMLLTRPEVSGGASIAVDTRGQDRRHLSIERFGARAVLATSDVRLTDIETRLAKLDASQSADNAPALPMDGSTRRVFTPTGWRQVIDESESSKPLPRKSSSSSYFQGVNT